MDKETNKIPEMKQDVNVTGSQDVTVIQAGGDGHYSEVKVLLPKDYKEYFDHLSKLRKDVFAHLSNWVDLNAVETRLTK